MEIRRFESASFYFSKTRRRNAFDISAYRLAVHSRESRERRTRRFETSTECNVRLKRIEGDSAMAAPVTGSNEIFHRRVRRSKRKRNSLRLVGHGRRVRRVIRRLVKRSLQRCATPVRSWNANVSRPREWRPRNRSRPFSLVPSLLCPAIVFHETDSFIFRRFNRCLFGRPDRITYRGHDAGYRCKLVLVFRLLITSWLNDGVRSLIEGLDERKTHG